MSRMKHSSRASLIGSRPRLASDGDGVNGEQPHLRDGLVGGLVDRQLDEAPLGEERLHQLHPLVALEGAQVRVVGAEHRLEPEVLAGVGVLIGDEGERPGEEPALGAPRAASPSPSPAARRASTCHYPRISRRPRRILRSSACAATPVLTPCVRTGETWRSCQTRPPRNSTTSGRDGRRVRGRPPRRHHRRRPAHPPHGAGPRPRATAPCTAPSCTGWPPSAASRSRRCAPACGASSARVSSCRRGEGRDAVFPATDAGRAALDVEPSAPPARLRAGRRRTRLGRPLAGGRLRHPRVAAGRPATGSGTTCSIWAAPSCNPASTSRRTDGRPRSALMPSASASVPTSPR